MDLIFPAKNIDKHLVEKYLLENNFELKFSAKQKIYYNFLRPLIPISVRQKIQHSYADKIEFKENFINSDFVDLIKEICFNENIYPDNYKTAVILTHDVEEEEGFNFIPKVMELEDSLGFKIFVEYCSL